MLRRALLPFLLLVVVVSTGFRQDPWAKQVREQLDAILDEMNLSGFALTHDPFVGSLDDAESEDLTVELEAGTEYYLVGACDEDCSDVDLALYNRSGGLVGQDVEEDDYPVLHVEPARAGTYTIRATMAACSEEPCRYGVGVYGN
ncbi:MAG: hypothetical protein AB1941_11680 [Gemmatimonadota bacterium]